MRSDKLAMSVRTGKRKQKAAVKRRLDDVKAIEDLKRQYREREKQKTRERDLNRIFFYFFCFILVALILFFMAEISNLHLFNSFRILSTSTEVSSVILYFILGNLFVLITFLMMDCRRNMNIAKFILDDIQQKIIILDSIPSLIANNKEFEGLDKKEYEKHILTALVKNILNVRCYGYLNNEKQAPLVSSFAEILLKIFSKN